jgi:hypothetical protein
METHLSATFRLVFVIIRRQEQIAISVKPKEPIGPYVSGSQKVEFLFN